MYDSFEKRMANKNNKTYTRPERILLKRLLIL
jgi:hypothetical protein